MTDPPRLIPPAAPVAAQDGTQARRSLWPGLSLVALLLTGLAVLMWLPGRIHGPGRTVGPDATGSAASAPADYGEQKKQAEDALAEVLHRRAVLEADDVSVWGGGDYQDILESTHTADEALGAARFPAAIAIYRQVLARLDRLDASRDARFDTAMTAGRAALLAANADQATNQFRVALALRPQDAQAREGLERAATIERVAALVRKGRTLEGRREWHKARQTYADALTLDPRYRPAQAGVERVSAAIREQDFQTAMSDLLNAVGQGAYSRAEQALARARALAPEAPELQEAAVQLAAARKSTDLGSLRRRGSAAEQGERWQVAAGLYRKAVKLEPTATFARDGLRRAEDRLELERRLAHYLARPDRLQNTPTLANARTLLKRLDAVRDAGPKFRAARASLRQLITAAQTPVMVRLLSDDATEIVIYRIGRLGRFHQRELKLRPGTYTAVGSRNGYRDVRKVFTLRADQPQMDIVIRCEERI